MWSHVLPSHGRSLHGDSPVWSEGISLREGKKRLYRAKIWEVKLYFKILKAPLTLASSLNTLERWKSITPVLPASPLSVCHCPMGFFWPRASSTEAFLSVDDPICPAVFSLFPLPLWPCRPTAILLLNCGVSNPMRRVTDPREQWALNSSSCVNKSDLKAWIPEVPTSPLLCVLLSYHNSILPFPWAVLQPAILQNSHLLLIRARFWDAFAVLFSFSGKTWRQFHALAHEVALLFFPIT